MGCSHPFSEATFNYQKVPIDHRTEAYISGMVGLIPQSSPFRAQIRTFARSLCFFSRDTTLLFHRPPDVCEGLLPQIVVKLAMKQISWEKTDILCHLGQTLGSAGAFLHPQFFHPQSLPSI